MLDGLKHEAVQFNCTATVKQVNCINMTDDEEHKRQFSDLAQLNLISCNNLLDTCGLENLPTSGHLTFTSITNESQKTINKFLHEKLPHCKDEFVNYEHANPGLTDANSPTEPNVQIEQNLQDLKQAFSKAHTSLKVFETVLEFSADENIQVTIDGQPVSDVGGKITKLVVYQTPANHFNKEFQRQEATLKSHIISCFN